MELRLPQLNAVYLCGRLVDEPHAMTGKDDVPGAAFTLALNKRADGKVFTTYVDVISWGETAKFVVASCGKGSPVIVAGGLHQYTRKNGKSETKVLQVSAQSVQLLTTKPKDETPAPTP